MKESTKLTFQDCIELANPGEDAMKMLEYKGTDPDVLAAIDSMKVGIGARAINKDWVPDYENGEQPKYEPLFHFVPGVGWVCGGFDSWATCTLVGPRHVYETHEKMILAVDVLIVEYNEMLEYFDFKK